MRFVSLLLLVNLCGLRVEAPCAQSIPTTSPVHTSTDSLHAQRLFIQGLLRYQLEDYAQAKALFEAALERVPEQPAILSTLAEVYAQEDQVERAYELAIRALNQAPDNLHYYYQVASLAEESGRLEQAISTYQALLERWPRQQEAWLALARLYHESGALEQAIQTYEAFLQHFGENPHVQYQLIQLYTQKGYHKRLEHLLEEMLTIQPENSSLRKMLIQLYLRTGASSQAINVLKQWTQQHPDDLDALFSLADLLRQQGNESAADSLMQQFMQRTNDSSETLYDQAKSILQLNLLTAPKRAEHLLRQALAQDSSYLPAIQLLGEVLYDQERFEEAAPLLERAARETVRELALWEWAAQAYLQAQQYRQALLVAEEALMLFPGQWHLLRIAGFAALQRYQNQKAREYLEEALTILKEEAPEETLIQAEIWAALGLLYARLQDIAQSDSAYLQAITLYPDHAPALNNYAYSLAEREERLETALQYAQRAVALEPQNPSYLDTLGWILFKLGRTEEALVTLEQAMALNPSNVTILEHLGDVYLYLKQPQHARNVYEKALKLEPERHSVREKLQQLIH